MGQGRVEETACSIWKLWQEEDEGCEEGWVGCVMDVVRLYRTIFYE